MEYDEDLISKYQALLEIEKRRLAVVNLSSTEEDDEYKHKGMPEYQTTERNNEKNYTNDAQKISTGVPKKEEVLIAKNIKCESNAKARAAAMDHWVTDSFYSSFPSFKKQDLAANSLADDRREDYKKYLAEVSNKKLLDVAKHRRRAEPTGSETVFSQETGKQTFSTRSKMLDDLKHSDLAYNFHNPDAIQERNEKIAIERTRRKIELQQELIRQIGEKKMEIEKIRAKEKEEDELLQRRLENQIKSLQLAEELHQQNTEKIRISNPISTMNSERELMSKFEKNKDTYKSFFSNSAPHNDSNANYYNNHSTGLDRISTVDPGMHHVSTAIHHSTQQCHHCRRPVPVLCSSCCQNNFNRSYECCDRCMNVCNSCRRPMAREWYHNRGGPLVDNTNTYQRNNRPQILEITYQYHSSQFNYKDDVIRSTHNNDPPDGRQMTTKEFNNISTDAINSPINNPVAEKHLEKVSPPKDDEILELKKKNDILIAKHARNYGSLRQRKPIQYEFETNRPSLDDSFPLPLMLEPVTTTASTNTDKYKSRQNSVAHKKLEYKWEIPVI